MGEDIDRHATDGVERIQYPHCVCCRKPKDVFPPADDHEGLERKKFINAVHCMTLCKGTTYSHGVALSCAFAARYKFAAYI